MRKVRRWGELKENGRRGEEDGTAQWREAGSSPGGAHVASILSRYEAVSPVINIQILQLFSCLKCTRQQILSTLRRQRSLATVLPIGTERRVCLRVCLSIIMGCRGERGRGRGEGEVASSQAHNATSFCARAEPAGRKLSARSRDPNHHFLTTRREGKQESGVEGGNKIWKKKNFLWFTELRNKQQNYLLWAECCLVSFSAYNSLNRHWQWNSRSEQGKWEKVWRSRFWRGGEDAICMAPLTRLNATEGGRGATKSFFTETKFLLIGS